MMSRNFEKDYQQIPQTVLSLEDRVYMNTNNSNNNTNSNRQQLPTFSGCDQSSNASCSEVSKSGFSCPNGGKFFGRNIVFSEFWHNQKSNVIYENLCKNCGYGVFQASGRFCDFCQYAVNGKFKEENIYENICENCGEIYSGNKCEVCLVDKVKINDCVLPKPKKVEQKTSTRILSGIFGTIKKVKSTRDRLYPAHHNQNHQSNPNSKNRKLEIIHNVDSVFRTNETFDLNRICELKRQQSNSDYHIYGKLRKSDDHLMNSYNYETIKPKVFTNSKSDPNLHKIYNLQQTGGRTSTAQREDSLMRSSVGASALSKSCKTDKKHTKILKTSDKKPKQLTKSNQQVLHYDHVIEWMTSLRSETHDYYILADDSICNTKSIPSRNFSCCGGGHHSTSYQVSFSPSSSSSSSTLGGSTTSSSVSASASASASSRLNQQFLGSDRSLHSILTNDLDYVKLINQFKRNLMEKQRSKRRAIYVKTEDTDTTITRSLVSGSGITLRTATSALNIDKLRLGNNNNVHNRNSGYNLNYFNKRHNRYGYCESPDSDFVSDILNVFDSFMNRRATPEIQSDIETLSSSTSTTTTTTTRNTENLHSNNINNNDIIVVEDITPSREEHQHIQHKPLTQKHKQYEVNLEYPQVKSDIECAEDHTIAESVNVNHGGGIVATANLHTNVNNSRTECIPYTECVKDVLGPRVQVKSLLSDIAISKSLNRILIFYDRNLSRFLNLISISRDFCLLDIDKLYRLYNLMIATSVDIQSCNGGNSRAIEYKTDNRRLGRCLYVEPTREESTMTVTTGAADDHIYQPIWKFQTVGNPPENSESDYYDREMTVTPPNEGSMISLSNIEDHGEWETDDEFMFTTKLSKDCSQETQSEIIVHETSSVKSMNESVKESKESNNPYQSVCIYYSVTEPNVRAIVYDYEPQRSYFNSHHKKSANSKNASLVNFENSEKIYEEINVPSQKNIRNSCCGNSRELPRTWIPDSVHAWKFMLLDVNYIDDEEDLYISEDEILKLKESDPGTTLHKSKSTGNLLEIPRGKKKSIGERVRNKLNRGVLKISSKIPKDKKDKEYYKPRSEVTSFYIDTDLKPKCPIFGVTLNEVEKYFYDYDVPQFVADCVAIIEQKEFIQSEGIYRASGNKTAIDDVKRKLVECPVYDTSVLKTQEVHTVTGLLKLFFRELKTPLIPDNLYHKLPENLVDKENLNTIKGVLLEIPSVSRGTLKFLLKHLTMVASHSSENRMPASNLAIIWGPCLLYSPARGPFDIARSNTLTKILIENYDTLFGDDERLVN